MRTKHYLISGSTSEHRCFMVEWAAINPDLAADAREIIANELAGKSNRRVFFLLEPFYGLNDAKSTKLLQDVGKAARNFNREMELCEPSTT